MQINNNKKNKNNRLDANNDSLNGSNKFDKLNYNLSKALEDANNRINDSNHIECIENIPFQMEQFSDLIINTYDDWYKDASLKWDINDYLEVINKSELEKHFSIYLEQNENNIVTMNNLPFLDLGDKPSTFNPKNNESEQIFIIP